MTVLRSILLLCIAGLGASASADWSDRQRMVLESQLETMPLPDALDDDQVLVDETMQLLGSVATSLLVRSDRAEPESAGTMPLMAATTLIAAMPDLRAAFDRLLDPDMAPDRRDAARHDLERFGRNARLHLPALSMPDPARYWNLMHSIFQPLQSALGHLEGAMPPSGWWSHEPEEREEDAVGPLLDIIESADWLTTSQRRKMRSRLDESVQVLDDEDVQYRVRPLLRMARAVADIREQPGGRLPAKRYAPVVVDAVLSGSGALPDEPGTVELARGLERAREFRLHERGELSRSLRTAHVRLSELYGYAERKLLEQSAQMLESMSPRSDPSLVVFIEDQRDNLDALAMLVQVPEQLDFVGSIDKTSVQPVERQLQSMIRDVLVPRHREDAMRALRNLSWQLNVFRVLPLESELRAADPAVDAMLGFRSRSIIEHIDAARRELVEDWGRGDLTGTGARTMHMIRRLLALSERAMQFKQDGSLDARLGPWAMWSLPPGQLDRWQDELWVRLRIAATALASGDDVEVSEQLDRLESDLAVLQLAHLLIEMGPDPPTATPAGAAVGQLVESPSDATWLIQHRRSFEQLARLAMAAQAADDEGEEESAEALHRSLAMHAATMHRRLAAPVRQLMPVPGFDGSNSSPELVPLRLEHDRRR